MCLTYSCFNIQNLDLSLAQSRYSLNILVGKNAWPLTRVSWAHIRMKNDVVFKLLKWKLLGFPGGAVVKNLPANAGDTGLSPGPGRPHMLWSYWARAPQLLSLNAYSPCSTTREATAMRSPRTATKSSPHLPQLEKAREQQRRPNAAKNKINKISKFKRKRKLFYLKQLNLMGTSLRLTI